MSSCNRSNECARETELDLYLVHILSNKILFCQQRDKMGRSILKEID